jgi:DNA mismatch endonuclease, patch repair protein
MERDQETNVHLPTPGCTVLRFWEHESRDDIMRQVAAAVVRKKAAEGNGGSRAGR